MGRRHLGAACALLVAAVVGGCAGGALLDSAGPQRAPGRPDAPARAATTAVVVLVRDGDTGRPLRGARVRVGKQKAVRTNRNGAAAFRVPWVGALRVRGSAPGYSFRRDRLRFGQRRFQVLRLYRPSLQWAMYGGGPRRTQTQTAIKVRPPFKVVWSKSLGFLEFPAVVSDGVAYVSNLNGRVRALSMRNGKVLWGRQTPNGKMAASPAVVGARVVAHGMDGRVWVLDRKTGRVRWTFRVGSPIESSPVIVDGVDYFGSWNGNVYALDLERRRLRWVFRSGYKITSSVAVAGRRLYVGDYGGRVWALSLTGRVSWRGSVGGRVYGTPAVAGGRVFVPSSTGRSLTAFSTGGRRLWSVHTGAYVYSSPAVWAGRVYFGSHNGVLYCVSARNGRVLWRFASGRPISGAPSVVAGIVYVGNTGRRLYGLDARTGRRVLTFRDGNYVPVSGNGGKLLLHGVSRLYAVAPGG
jgi:outer membrane protein assembly factor BamB